MSIQALRKSFSKRISTEFEPILRSVPANQRQKMAEEAVGLLRRIGALILRRADVEALADVKRFQGEILAVFQRLSLDVAEFQRVETEAAAISKGYQTILATLDTLPLSQRAPASQALALIKYALHEVEDINNAVAAEHERKGPRFEPAAIHIERPGARVGPDTAHSTVVETVGAALKMLSYRHGWFDSAGRIRIPASQEVDVPYEEAEQVAALGSRWRLFEYFEGRSRMFDGETISETRDGGETLRFEVDHTWELLEHVAQARLNRRDFQAWMEIRLSNAHERVVAGEILSATAKLPPEALVSLEELRALGVLAGALQLSPFTDKEEYGGLTLIEWTRAYAVLHRLASECCSGYRRIGAEPSLLEVNATSFIDAMGRLGMVARKAEQFLKSATFGRASDDPFDCPLICVGDRVVCIANSFSTANVPSLVLSQLKSQRIGIAKKGEAFEQATREFLHSKGLEARRLKFFDQDTEVEIDICIPWGDVLFVIECKNYSTSHLDPAASRDFREKIEEAVSQVSRAADALKLNPGVLEAAFGRAINFTRLVRVVLNSLPWNAPAASPNDVLIYDVGALRQFFEQKHIKIQAPLEVDGIVVLIRHGVAHYWTGDAPSANDLIDQMGCPWQTRLLVKEFQIEQIETDLGEQLRFAGGVFRSLEPDMERMLAAHGLPAETVKQEIEQIKERIRSSLKAAKENAPTT